jgi:hypothetical protein
MCTAHRIDVHHHIVSRGYIEELRSLLLPPGALDRAHGARHNGYHSVAIRRAWVKIMA